MCESNEVIELLKDISKQLESIDSRLSSIKDDASVIRSNTDNMSLIRNHTREIKERLQKKLW